MEGSKASEGQANTLPTGAIAALNKGKKIEAIKIVRTQRRVGLKESKELVEAYLASQPALQRKIEAKQAEARRGCLIWAVSLILLAVAAYYYLFLRPV
jgi:ribosomal protein L7/L12